MPHNEPRKVIKDGVIIEDSYTLIDSQEQLDRADDSSDIIVSLELYLANKEQLASRLGSTGVAIGAEGSIENILDDLDTLAVITLDFPTFMDGRSYSYARELRQRHNYQGELRATGDVLKDQLYYMQQVGFTSFTTREDVDIEIAVTALNDYSQTYLGDIYNHNPWFKR